MHTVTIRILTLGLLLAALTGPARAQAPTPFMTGDQWLGIVVTLVLALFDQRLHDNVFNLLIVLMGILPLVAAVREAYAQKRAEKELIKQYLFMARIFTNARRQLDRAKNDDQLREILRALGNAALDEHAEWILMHRERPLEHGKL
jgi:cadmium resistance protein CadD (predicted permease)